VARDRLTGVPAAAFFERDDVVAEPRHLGIGCARDGHHQLGGATRRQGEEHGLGRVVDPVDIAGLGLGGLAGLLPPIQEQERPLIPEGQMGQGSRHRPVAGSGALEVGLAETPDESLKAGALRIIVGDVAAIDGHGVPPGREWDPATS
jgi:hypothetical protein